MRIGTVIEARMTSSRLPGKHMRKVGEKYVFEILVEQLRFSKLCSEFVLATTVNKEDDALVALAVALGLKVYRGSEDNVYERVVGAALTNHIDLIVEITADCPLIDPSIVDEAISTYIHNEYDYVSNCVVRDYPDGMDVQVYKTELLRASRNDILDLDWLEHVTLQFRSKEGRDKYNVFDLRKPEFGSRPDLEVTLDEVGDLKLITEVYSQLKNDSGPIPCYKIIEFLDDNPEIKALTNDVRRK